MEIFLLALLAFSIAALFGVRVLAWIVVTPVALWALMILYFIVKPTAGSDWQ